MFSAQAKYRREIMSYDTSKLTKLGALRALAERVINGFVAKEDGKGLSANDFTDAYKTKIDSIDALGGESVTIETIKVNGTVQAISNKTVDITVPTKLSALTNDSDFITEADVNTKLSTVYRYKGSVATYSALPSAGQSVGDTYNVVAAYATKNVKAGDNVSWTGSDWDVLAGTVDLSAYSTTTETATLLASKVDKVTGKALSTNDLTDALKAKLDAISTAANKTAKSTTNGSILIDGTETVVYTLPSTVLHTTSIALDSEISEMLTEVFG